MNKFEQQISIEITKLANKVNAIIDKLKELDNKGKVENKVEETELNINGADTLENKPVANIENIPDAKLEDSTAVVKRGKA